MIEVLKQALEALERSVATCYDQYAHQQVMSQPNHFINQTITSLRKAIQEEALRNVQRLGQEIEQEPVAWVNKERNTITWDKLYPDMDALYTHPPQRKEQDLSEQGRNRSAILGNNIEEMVNNGLPFLTALDTALKVYDHHTPQLHPPQRTWVGLDWLPEHKCGLHLSHNEHRDVYETIEQFYNVEDFISIEEWRKAIAEDSVWVLQWYPDTPIGSYRIAASTLEAIEAKLKEKNT